MQPLGAWEATYSSEIKLRASGSSARIRGKAALHSALSVTCNVSSHNVLAFVSQKVVTKWNIKRVITVYNHVAVVSITIDMCYLLFALQIWRNPRRRIPVTCEFHWTVLLNVLRKHPVGVDADLKSGVISLTEVGYSERMMGYVRLHSDLSRTG